MQTIDEFRKQAKSKGVVPVYNGLGMVRLKIGNQGFLFYSDRAPAINMTIHTHRYDFTSTVLKGAIRNYLYVPKLVGHETNYKLTWKDMVEKVDTEGNTINENVEPLNVCTFNTVAGESYFLQRNVYHHVESVTPKLITRMDVVPPTKEELASRDTYWPQKAYFIIDKTIPYVGVYSQPKSEKECWEIIEYTLNDND
jgi:hypothetical protein